MSGHWQLDELADKWDTAVQNGFTTFLRMKPMYTFNEIGENELGKMAGKWETTVRDGVSTE